MEVTCLRIEEERVSDIYWKGTDGGTTNGPVTGGETITVTGCGGS